MSFHFESLPGIELDVASGTAKVSYRARGVTGLGVDPFDFVASYAMDPNTGPPRTLNTTIGILFLQNIQIQENHCGRSYLITAPYSRANTVPRNQNIGAYQITIDTTGGTVNCKAGTRVAGYTATGKDVGDDLINNHGLIGVEKDDVKGVEWPIPVCKITVMFRHPQGFLTSAYRDRTEAVACHPNSDVFLGYKPYEVLYKGGNFMETNTEATATYNFEIQKQMLNFDVGGITIDKKEGWEVLSITYAPHDASVPQMKVQCVERIKDIGGYKALPYKTAFGWG